jgi:hypothetical protein
MEQNDSVDSPAPCIAGCGFYGNKIYNGMCSKCFKEAQAQVKKGKYGFRIDEWERNISQMRHDGRLMESSHN